MPSGRKIQWTEDELNYLIENAALGCKQLSINLAKPVNTIRDRAYILRLSLKRNNSGSGRNLKPGVKRRHDPKPKRPHLVLNPFDDVLLNLYPNAIKKQRALWRRRRAVILKIHDYSCYYCGDAANTVDHIKPRHLGGQDNVNNLVAACTDCNFGWIQHIPWRTKYVAKKIQGA